MAGSRGTTPLTTRIGRILRAHGEAERTGVPVADVIGRAQDEAARRTLPTRRAAYRRRRRRRRRPRDGRVPRARRRHREAGHGTPDRHRRRRPRGAAGRALAAPREGPARDRVRGQPAGGRPVPQPARVLRRRHRRRARRCAHQHGPQRDPQPRLEPRAQPRRRRRRQLPGLGRQVLDRRRRLPLRRRERGLGRRLPGVQGRARERALLPDLRRAHPGGRRARPDDGRRVAGRQRARRPVEPVREAHAVERHGGVRPRAARAVGAQPGVPARLERPEQPLADQRRRREVLGARRQRPAHQPHARAASLGRRALRPQARRREAQRRRHRAPQLPGRQQDGRPDRRPGHPRAAVHHPARLRPLASRASRR